jgi:hypothetical protein
MGEYNFDFDDINGIPAIVALNGDLDLDCGSDDNPGEDIYITDNGDGVVIFRWDVADHDTCENIYNFEIALYEDGRFSISYGDMGIIDPDEIEGEIGVTNGIGGYKGGYKLSQYNGNVELNNVGTSGWNWEDNDGVDSTVEDAAPNNGDANNDGTLDSLQATVTSTVSPVSNQYVVLEAGGVCSENESVLIEQETTVVDKDDDIYDYPAGLLDFSLSGCSVGGTETITLFYFGDFDIDDVVLRKYDKSNDTYTNIDNAVLSAVTIGGENAIRAVYTVTDGGELDADGVVNGVIVDPVGLGTIAASAPNTGFQQVSQMPVQLALFAGGILAVFGVYGYRKNQQ